MVENLEVTATMVQISYFKLRNSIWQDGFMSMSQVVTEGRVKMEAMEAMEVGRIEAEDAGAGMAVTAATVGMAVTAAMAEVCKSRLRKHLAVPAN